MADLGSNLPIVAPVVTETDAMLLKWTQMKKQEIVSRIVHLKQAMEDLRLGKMAELEYALMKAEAELDGWKKKEEMIKNSVSSTAVEGDING